MADYPDSVYTPRAKENKSGVVYDPTKKTVLFVEDLTKLEDEVVALETYSKYSTEAPASPVAGSSWFDPATGILSIYDGSSWLTTTLT